MHIHMRKINESNKKWININEEEEKRMLEKREGRCVRDFLRSSIEIY